MIFVTQGHEKSIALESFFKSVFMLSKKDQSKFILVANKDVIINNLEDLNTKYTFEKDSLNIYNTNFNVNFIQSL